MNMVCKCGGKEFFTEEHGNQTGLYCSACGKWQKWLKKDEIRLFNHGVKVENASLLERLKARIEESAIKVSTVKAPHTYTVLLTSVPATRKCSLTALSQKPHTTFGLRGSAAKITESLC